MRDTILIAQISDLHLVPKGSHCYGSVDTNGLAERAIDAINRLKTQPHAVLVTGDVIDTARAEDYRIASEVLERLDVPFYLLAGNHDQSAGLKRAFVNHPCSSSAPTNRLYYAIDIGAIRLVVLDSSVPGAPHGELEVEQLDFLDRELASAKERPVIVAVHHPPIETGNRHMDAFGLADPSRFAAVIERYGNVLRVLCGHCHRTVFGSFAGTIMAIGPSTGHQLELSLDGDETFAFNREPPAFLLHRWTPTDGMTSQVALVDRYPGPFPFSWDNAANPAKSN